MGIRGKTTLILTGILTVALVGFDGGRLAKLCDHVIHIQSKKGEYGPVEDIHLILNHMIVSYLMMELKKKKKTKVMELQNVK